MIQSDPVGDLLQPFQYEFFRNGMIGAVIVGALCGSIGVYVILRRMSYIGHGLAHALFAGAVVSTVVGVNFFAGAGIWALLCACLIHLISHRRLVGADAAIGVVTTSSFALGVAILSTHRRFNRDFEAALFGNLLGITPADLWIITAISLGVFLTLIVIRHRLLFSTFDPEVAPVYGISTGRTDLLFVVLLAVTILASTQVLGVTLVSAAIVIPPVIARYLSERFQTLLVLSPLIGAFCGAAGMYASFYFDISSAAMVVLTFAGVFLLVEARLWLKR